MAQGIKRLRRALSEVLTTTEEALPALERRGHTRADSHQGQSLNAHDQAGERRAVRPMLPMPTLILTPPGESIARGARQRQEKALWQQMSRTSNRLRRSSNGTAVGLPKWM